MSVLFDTNVVSEVIKKVPDPQTLAFVKRSRAWISVITFHEMRFGLETMPRGKKRDAIELGLANLFSEYSDRLLPIHEHEAQRGAIMRADVRKRGRVLHLPDAFIAATAYEHRLTLATRNVSDFEGLGIEVVNPWNS